MMLTRKTPTKMRQHGGGLKEEGRLLWGNDRCLQDPDEDQTPVTRGRARIRRRGKGISGLKNSLHEGSEAGDIMVCLAEGEDSEWQIIEEGTIPCGSVKFGSDCDIHMSNVTMGEFGKRVEIRFLNYKQTFRSHQQRDCVQSL